METVLDLRSFDPRFQSALIFSIFDGLREGCAFMIICDEDPSHIESQFHQAHIPNAQMERSPQANGSWQMQISKVVALGK